MGKLSSEEFTGIRKLIDTLLEEGPRGNIENIKNGNKCLEVFLKQAKDFDLDENDRKTVSKVEKYLARRCS